MIKDSLKLLLFFFMVSFVSACNKEEPQVANTFNPPYPGTQFCLTGELPVVSDGEVCSEPPNGFICEVIEVEEVLFIDEEGYEWAPNICEMGIGTQLVFKNGDNLTTWDIVESAHFINEERLNVSCNGNYEQTTYICQKNEVIAVSFLNNFLGPDTLTFELKTSVLSYQNQMPGKKENLMSLWQDRSNTNIANFYLVHRVGSEYDDTNNQSYLEEISLNGQLYKDVVRYQYGDNYWAEPHTKYYIQKGLGILGFEENGKLWLRE